LSSLANNYPLPAHRFSSPFVFILLQIPFPATLFVSHPYKPRGIFCALSRHSPLPLCFHQLAASLASPKMATPLQSSKSRLFCQNAGVWGGHPGRNYGTPRAGYPLRSLCSALSALCVAPLPASHVFSTTCRLLVSLASLFRAPFLCFQQLAASFAKNRGVWEVDSD
jgi:hypothetical protein